MTDLSYLAENLAVVQDRMKKAAERAGRKLQEVKLIAVSKTVGRAEVAEMARLGLRNFGENRIADAEEKFTSTTFENIISGSIEDTAPTLHLIGHLQTNKVKRAVALFDIIHSVDNLHLAEVLDKQAEAVGKRLPILLQVNVAEEASKQGTSVAELPALLEQTLEFKNLEVRGLMTIAPNFPEPEQARPVFAQLRELFEKYRQIGPQWSELSMGMTNDFEIAIEEGATLIRVGRALFLPQQAD